MEDFKNVYPACNVYICSQWMRQNISAVLDGTLDFAFAYMVDEEYRSLLHFIPIFDDEIMVAIPASHPSVKEIRTNPKPGCLGLIFIFWKTSRSSFKMNNAMCAVQLTTFLLI